MFLGDSFESDLFFSWVSDQTLGGYWIDEEIPFCMSRLVRGLILMKTLMHYSDMEKNEFL